MTVQRFPPDDAREWLNRARSNLALARGTGLGVYLEDLCFEAQQAAEKALKAVLLHRRASFPYVHDLAALLTLLIQSGQEMPAEIADAAELTPFAVVTRYPGPEPVSREEYERAVTVAEAVVRWAERVIGRGDG